MVQKITIKHVWFAMTDTPLHIQQLQQDKWLSKTPEERFQIGFEMMELGRLASLERLQREFPEKTDKEIKFELIKEWYGKDLSVAQLKKIENMLMER